MNTFFLFFGGVVSGILLLIGYGAFRAVRSDGWDDSNVLNWIRLFSHIVMHPEDFTKMYYIYDARGEIAAGLPVACSKEGWGVQSPFPYLSNDEFSENFPSSRP